MVCISGFWTSWNRFLGYPFSPGSDIGICGYAAASGRMGISETLFLTIFSPVFGGLLLPGMVLSRGLGYYGELLISAVFTAVAQLTIGKKES